MIIDTTNKVSVCPAKTQISLGIRPVWSESSLSAWRKLGSLATHWAHSQDSNQSGWMPRLIWVFAGRRVTLLVFSLRGSNIPSVLEHNVWRNWTHQISLVTRKSVFRVRHKPACSASETSWCLEISAITSRGIVLSRQRKTKVLIRLRECAGWSAPLLFAWGKNRFSHDKAHISCGLWEMNSNAKVDARMNVDVWSDEWTDKQTASSTSISRHAKADRTKTGKPRIWIYWWQRLVLRMI